MKSHINFQNLNENVRYPKCRIRLTRISRIEDNTHLRAVSSAVEHWSYTPGATGSSPVPPTIPLLHVPASKVYKLCMECIVNV